MLDYRALIILPLMLGDYLLTLVGEVLRRKRYQEQTKPGYGSTSTVADQI